MGGCPESGYEAGVAVDGAGDHGEQFGHEFLLPAEIPAHGVGYAVFFGFIPEDRFAVESEEGSVDVSGLSGPVG